MQEFGINRRQTAIQTKASRLKRGWSRKVKKSRTRRTQRRAPELITNPSHLRTESSSNQNSESAPQSVPAHIRAPMGVSQLRQTRPLPSKNTTGKNAQSGETPDIIMDTQRTAENMEDAGPVLPLTAQSTTPMHSTGGRNLSDNHSLSLGSLLS